MQKKEKRFKCEDCGGEFEVNKFVGKDLLSKTLYNTKLICRKCKVIMSRRKTYLKYRKKRIARVKKYFQTAKGKESKKRANKKYNKTHRKEINERNRNRRKKRRTENNGD